MKSNIPDTLDIHRTASIIVGEHGDDALLYAAQRHDELLEAGDVDGVIVWGRIVKVVRELLSQGVPGGRTVH